MQAVLLEKWSGAIISVVFHVVLFVAIVTHLPWSQMKAADTLLEGKLAVPVYFLQMNAVQQTMPQEIAPILPQPVIAEKKVESVIREHVTAPKPVHRPAERVLEVVETITDTQNETVNSEAQEVAESVDSHEITKYAPQIAGNVTGGEGEKNYRSELVAALERHKRYPRYAKNRGLEGEALLEFTLDTEGNVTHYHVAKSSGESILDKAAVNTLKAASPFPPVPKKLQVASLAFKVPLLFQMGR